MKTIYRDIIQGTDEWFAARCGILTASNIKNIMTAGTNKPASNDKSRAHVWEIAAQRITKHVEAAYSNDDIERGHMDEIEALMKYSENYGEIEQVGFITNDKWGFTLGYSPDALIVGKNGAIEVKSRRQRFQLETIINGTMPADYLLQVQAGMMIAELDFIDFISYSGGMPMLTVTVFPDEAVQSAILEACADFEAKVKNNVESYYRALDSGLRLVETERKFLEEM